MRILSANEMRKVEQHASRFGFSYERMTENAGAACARSIRNIIEKKSPDKKDICILCGKGNNGADGFVIARKLYENGYGVTVVLCSGYPQSEEAVNMYKTVLDMGLTTVWYDSDREKTFSIIKNTDTIIDCVFGFGFYGKPDDDTGELFSAVNESGAVVFSVDIPSGVYCDSGLYCDKAIKADYTVAISSLKPCNILYPGAEMCGNIIVTSIGIPEESFNEVKNQLYTYTSPKETSALFPVRDMRGNKGTFGRVLCICGSRKMTGAAELSVKAALRSGAGLVTLAFPECMYIPMATKLTEALLLPLEANNEGTLSEKAIPQILEEAEKSDCILIGCGMGLNDETVKITSKVISQAKCPVIIDADGINAVATDIDMLKRAAVPLVLTPHPGEMARLIKSTVEAVQSDRMRVVTEFVEKYPVTLLLKGANSLAASTGRDDVYVNSTGNTGLSKGGSGDLLAGLIAGFTAQGMSPRTAVSAGAYIHGYLGEYVSDEYSVRGMLPGDMIKLLPKVLADFS